MDTPTSPTSRLWSRSSFGSEDAMTILTTASVRNSLGSGNGILEEEDLSEADQDVEDEVFVREPNRRGFSLLSGGSRFGRKNLDPGAAKPLMAPRKKIHLGTPSVVIPKRGMLCRAICPFISYLILALVLFLGLIGLVVVVINYAITALPLPSILDPHSKQNVPVTCERTSSEEIWAKSFPGVQATHFASFKINDDLVPDVVVGFTSGLEGLEGAKFACEAYFASSEGSKDGKLKGSCNGGLRAVDGVTGKTLWTSWVDEVIDGIDCTEDLDHDGTFDCVFWGKKGVAAISGRSGAKIWTFSPEIGLNLAVSLEGVVRRFTAALINDANGDQSPDVLVSVMFDCRTLTGEEESFIWALNGKDGSILSEGTSNQKSSSSSDAAVLGAELLPLCLPPSVIVSSDGASQLLLAFEEGLKLCPLVSGFFLDDCGLKDEKGSKGKNLATLPSLPSLPPVFADLNEDGQEDVILCLENSTIAINLHPVGNSNHLLWSLNANPNVGNCIDIAVGKIDGDSTPDVVVKFGIYGPHDLGFTQVIFINGRTGQKIQSQIYGPEFLPNRFSPWTGSKGILGLTLKSELTGRHHAVEVSDLMLLPLAGNGSASNSSAKGTWFDVGSLHLQVFSGGSGKFETAWNPAEEMADLEPFSSIQLAEKFLSSRPDLAHKFSPKQATKIHRQKSSKIGKPKKEKQGRLFGQMGEGYGITGKGSYVEVPPMVPYAEEHVVRKHGKFGVNHRSSSQGLLLPYPGMTLSSDADDRYNDNLFVGKDDRIDSLDVNNEENDDNVDDDQPFPIIRSKRDSSSKRERILIPSLSLGTVTQPGSHDSAIDVVFAIGWIPVDKKRIDAARCLAGLLKDEASGLPDLNICKQDTSTSSQQPPQPIKNAFQVDLPQTIIRKVRITCHCKTISRPLAALSYILRGSSPTCPVFLTPSEQSWAGETGTFFDGHYHIPHLNK